MYSGELYLPAIKPKSKDFAQLNLFLQRVGQFNYTYKPTSYIILFPCHVIQYTTAAAGEQKKVLLWTQKILLGNFSFKTWIGSFFYESALNHVTGQNGSLYYLSYIEK